MIRNIYAIVLNGHQFPIADNSQLDIVLLRLANQALQRQQLGIVDSFLFVICGSIDSKQQTLFTPTIRDLANLDKYGFPVIELVSVDTTDENGDEVELDDVQECIGNEISKWLKEKYPAAITSLSSTGSDELDVWWSGIEAIPDKLELPFELEDFAKNLPGTHQARASTWLAILGEVSNFQYGEGWISDNQFRLKAIALCEWLNGFEGASGNGYNDFEAGYAGNSMELDDFYMGCIWGQENPKELIDDKFEESDCDSDDMKSSILAEISAGMRQEIRDLLTEYFGSETVLFWALYTSIWPKFDKPVAEALENIVGLRESDYEDVAEPWMFVTDGWTDSADAG